ncbi:MAG: hypothetical protein EWM72_00974 [Nitrospira sp.]|nr:MAG: hypothetical protein EWM72_00974 [Nitrospira sp.]
MRSNYMSPPGVVQEWFTQRAVGMTRLIPMFLLGCVLVMAQPAQALFLDSASQSGMVTRFYDGHMNYRDTASQRGPAWQFYGTYGTASGGGFSGGLNQGLNTGNDYHLRFYGLGRQHQLAELALQLTRTHRLLLDVLDREAHREQTVDDITNALLQQWHDEGAQSRIDWERQCPEQAAWVRAHVQLFGPDSTEALTARLQAVSDCPPGR